MQTERSARPAGHAEEDERAAPGRRAIRIRSWRRASSPTNSRSGCRCRRRKPPTSSSESEATKKLYGLDDPVSADFGGRCLLARRLVERGVRFVQVWSGDGMNATDWDGHIAVRPEPSGQSGADRQGGRRAADGSEVARTAGFDAGDLGRRVRPQPDVRWRLAAAPRAATTIRTASRSGWRAAA